MATIIVNTTLDENDGSIADGDVSLRDAMAAAGDGDTISFASGPGAPARQDNDLTSRSN